MMKSISNKDGQRLTSLMFESIPAVHHGDILKSSAVDGPVVTFFNKVYFTCGHKSRAEEESFFGSKRQNKQERIVYIELFD